MAGRLLEKARAVDDGAALNVFGAEHHPADSGVADGAGAHGAGLQCHIESEAGQAVVAEPFGRLAQGQNLRMGGGVVGRDGGVVGRAQHLAGAWIDYNGADRGLSGVGGGLREVERDAHVRRVMVDHPRRPPAQPAPRQETHKPDLGKAPETDGERVAKAMARAGVASRREVERLIEAGRVALNGEVLTSPAVKVGPGDLLTVDGKLVEAAEPTRVWRYHKPPGLVTTHNDPHGRPTVFQHLPAELPRVISVGRLDLASEGLLLLTNDGELARALELPSSGWVRRYRARAYGSTTQAKLDKLQQGITVDGVAYGAIEATLDKVKAVEEGEKAAANLWITVALTEGKNREVRRVLEAIGLKVNRLIRLAYGPYVLGTLPVGAVEEIGPRVIREQLADLIAPANMPQGDRRPAPILSLAPPRRNPTMARSSRTGPSGAVKPAGPPAARRGAEPVEPEKKERKPGWAKPKSKANPHAPPKTKDRRDGRPPAAAAAKPRGTQIDQWPASHKPRGGAKPHAPRGESKLYAPKPYARSGEARPTGKTYGAAKPSGPRADARPAKHNPRESPPRIQETEVTPWAKPAPGRAFGSDSPPVKTSPRPTGRAKPGGFKPGGSKSGGPPRGGPSKPRGARPPKGR
jgi:23S rRNA pseudouridine2605 synthase